MIGGSRGDTSSPVSFLYRVCDCGLFVLFFSFLFFFFFVFDRGGWGKWQRYKNQEEAASGLSWGFLFFGSGFVSNISSMRGLGREGEEGEGQWHVFPQFEHSKFSGNKDAFTNKQNKKCYSPAPRQSLAYICSSNSFISGRTSGSPGCKTWVPKTPHTPAARSMNWKRERERETG